MGGRIGDTIEFHYLDTVPTERQETQTRGVDAYTVMKERASAIPPGSNGLNGIFSNVMEAKRWRHAPPSLVGFDLLDAAGTGKAACIRAIEENAAFVTRGHLDILKELSGETPEEMVFMRGAAKGSLWPQIVANVTRRRLRIPVVKETTSLGATKNPPITVARTRGVGIRGVQALRSGQAVDLLGGEGVELMLP
jgi:sugar (pentulose or hexulose) kinase